MTIEELHYDFDLKLNKVSSNQRLNFNAAEKDWFINSALMQFIKTRISGNNPLKQGFEENQKRMDDLSRIHIKSSDQPELVLNAENQKIEKVCGRDVYVNYISVSSLVYKYLYLTRIQLKKNGSLLDTFVSQTDDIQYHLRNPFSINKKNSIVSIGKDKIYVYSLFPIDSILIEYLKYPDLVNLGNYTYIDGLIKPKKTIELSDHTHNEIIDLAVEQAMASIGDASLQMQAYKINKHE